MTNLERALRTGLEDTELAAPLAAVLAAACETGSISYDEVTEKVGNQCDETLLFGNRWRLLIPTKVDKSSAWEDRMLQCNPEETYEVPNVVRHLVQNASRTGRWEPMVAITEIFKELGEEVLPQVPELVTELGRQARDGQISAVQVREACITADLGDKVDVLIAELKAVGVMSPKLSSLAEVTRVRSPLYDLNPSLFK
jgi:hypothetical protein